MKGQTTRAMPTPQGVAAEFEFIDLGNGIWGSPPLLAKHFFDRGEDFKDFARRCQASGLWEYLKVVLNVILGKTS